MCALAMDAVLDKLKLLRYEEGLLRPRRPPPLARGYFVGAALWPVLPHLLPLPTRLLAVGARHGPAAAERLWSLLPTLAPTATTRAAPPPPRSSTSSAVRAARSAPRSDGAGSAGAAGGPDVCALLNTLTDVALSASGFAWAAPQYGDGEDDGVIEEAGDAADDGDATTLTRLARPTTRSRRPPATAAAKAKATARAGGCCSL